MSMNCLLVICGDEYPLFYLDLIFIGSARSLQIEQLRFLAISVVKNMCIQMIMLTDRSLLMIHSLL